jgi:hypothetical protein
MYKYNIKNECFLSFKPIAYSVTTVWLKMGGAVKVDVNLNVRNLEVVNFGSDLCSGRQYSLLLHHSLTH